MATLYFIEKGVFWKPTPPSGVSSKFDIPALGWGSDRVSNQFQSRTAYWTGQARLKKPLWGLEAGMAILNHHCTILRMQPGVRMPGMANCGTIRVGA